MKIDSEFENLSFHDASIDLVERSQDRLSLMISGAFIGAKHSQSQGLDWHVARCIMRFIAVSSETAVTCLHTSEVIENTTPEFPLDEIMHATFENGIFQINGLKDTVPWHEWAIEAEGFELVILESSKISS